MVEIQDLKSFIGSSLFIDLKPTQAYSERQLCGILVASDNNLNLLIENTLETTKQEEFNTKEVTDLKRELGLVSVPFGEIKSIKIENSDLQKIYHAIESKAESTA
ncbi:hypothetical protein ACO0QE_004027 [Hanseniaspora vineae]